MYIFLPYVTSYLFYPEIFFILFDDWLWSFKVIKEICSNIKYKLDCNTCNQDAKCW